MMHRTESIDYALILSGEITMLLDDEEVLLKSCSAAPIMPGAIAPMRPASSPSS
jgi:hypothetical protein